ncbi:hypothetical protein AAHH67_01830 [Niallia circulans]
MENDSIFGEISNEWLNFLDLNDYLLLEEKHVEEAIERLRLLPEQQFLAFLIGKSNFTDANTNQQKVLKNLIIIGISFAICSMITSKIILRANYTEWSRG